MSTTKRHVTFEFRCERDYLIDFDPDIVGICGGATVAITASTAG